MCSPTLIPLPLQFLVSHTHFPKQNLWGLDCMQDFPLPSQNQILRHHHTPGCCERLPESVHHCLCLVLTAHSEKTLWFTQPQSAWFSSIVLPVAQSSLPPRVVWGVCFYDAFKRPLGAKSKWKKGVPAKFPFP